MQKTLQQKIDELNPWMYDVTIGEITVTPGIGSPHSAGQLIADANYKRDILVDQIISRYDFTGKKVLDVASNCAYWSSFYAMAGASFVLAVDGRELFLKQGRLYWDNNKNVHNCGYGFLLGDINSDTIWKQIELYGPFDVILCCGILYHISDHRRLLSHINSVAKDIVIIDTRVSEPGDPKTQPFVERGNWGFDGIHVDGKPAVASHPTFDSICEFLSDHNYAIERIVSKHNVSPLMSPNDDYSKNRRITLLCQAVGSSYDQYDLH